MLNAETERGARSGQAPDQTLDLGAYLRSHAGATAVQLRNDHITYAQLFGAALRRAKAYDAARIPQNARVLIDCAQQLRTIVECWALWISGRCAVPLNSHWNAAQRQEFAESFSAEYAISTQPDFVAGIHQVSLVDLKSVDSKVWDRTWDLRLNFSAPASIIATSGSTGAPKAAQHSIANHYWSAVGANLNIPLSVGDFNLLNLPLYHVGGMALLWRSVLSGAGLLIPQSAEVGKLSLPPVAATHISMVPTQLYRALRNGWQPAKSRLKALLIGGGAITPALLTSALAHGLPLHTTYGSTEMSSQVTTTPAGADKQTLQSSGRILQGREVCIDSNNQILLRGQTLFNGYVVQAHKLHTARDTDGWYLSGDLGRLDKAGNLHVIGRKDNMFICGGENIQPETIERELLQLPGIVQAVVLGKSDAEYGHRPYAFLECERGIDADSIQSALRERLPGLWIPIAFTDLPLNSPGLKPQRKVLKELIN